MKSLQNRKEQEPVRMFNQHGLISNKVLEISFWAFSRFFIDFFVTSFSPATGASLESLAPATEFY